VYESEQGKGKKKRFTALLHHVTVDLLRTSYLKLKRDAAPGVDGTTWREYGQDLETKLGFAWTRSSRRLSGAALAA
jgi:hypothetical protein